ncbi:MAG: right-handed parallel beta-helix repeat-containing protein [Methylococcaceae bacterium]
MIKSPTWHLFERMQLAAQNNNAINKKDFLLLQQKKSNNKIITLTNNNITEVNINEAIEQLRKTGGEIHVGEGVCEFSQSLCIPTGISLSGILDRTDFVFNNVDYAIQIQGSVTELITDVSIKNIRIFHRGDHTFCACVLITHTERVHFENVTIASPRAIGFLLADHVYNTTFLNCVVHHAGLVGFMLVRDVRETLLKDCRAEYCQQSGIFLTDLKLPDHIDALDFEKQLHHTDYLIGNFAPFSITDPSPYRTDLINCVFSHNRKMGITTDGVGYLSVKNCIIAHNDCEGITIDNGSWGCSITACHIYNNGWRGYQHEVELGIDFVDVVGLMPDGSSKAKLPGISIDNAAFTRIENNHIECNWGDGIKMVRAVYASSLCHNLIEHNNRGVNDKFHYFGVLIGVSSRQHPDQDDFPSCNNQIIGNDILGGHFAGIHLMLGVSGNIVERNQIYGATFAAIEDHNMPGNVVLPPLNNR